MSIFKTTFVKEVREQLDIRQKAIKSRDPKVIHQLTTRNAWVRMTSSVNVNNSDALARKYILQGGVLENGALKPGGVGNSYEISPTRGIRPMPGIISVDVKSKTAYGSLREATVSFSCNSIEQLEDLERLYMRPGYTVLLEWGWLPYLDNKGELKTNLTDINTSVINGTFKTMPEVFKDLFDRSKNSNGNYDALFGKVMNYNWTARPDGGYDCQTTLISIGEVIESLKVNSVPLDVEQIATNGGILGTKVVNNKTLKDEYSLNKLNGLLAELKEYANSKISSNNLSWAGSFTSKGTTYDLFSMVVSAVQQSKIDDKPIGTSVEKAYITLESFTKLLNEHIILRVATDASGSNSQPIAKISTNTSDIIYEKTEPLNCLGHPYQVSTDINVCLIYNNIFAQGKAVQVSTATGGTATGTTQQSTSTSPRGPEAFKNTAVKVYNELKRIHLGTNLKTNNPIIVPSFKIGDIILQAIKPDTKKNENLSANFDNFVKALYLIEKNINDVQIYLQTLVGDSIWVRAYAIGYPITGIDTSQKGQDPFYTLSDNTNSLIKYDTNGQKSTIPDEGNPSSNRSQLTSLIQLVDVKALASNVVNSAQAIADIQDANPSVPVAGYLELISRKGVIDNFKKFHQGGDKEQLGIIGNIYLNIDMLKQLATSNNIGSDKREIQLSSYLKTIMSKVQESIGNLNNFDIHVDPTDGNVGRIIDVNFAESSTIKNDLKSSNNDKKAFLIEVANLNSIVRSYELQSQIFPNQSSLVAIGAQVKGGGDGAQGTQNYALLSFNRGITDRNLPAKIDPKTQDSLPNPEKKLEYLKSNLNLLNEYLFPKTSQIQLDVNRQESSTDTIKYKNALRDTIAYSLGIDNSPIRSNSIIPIKLSLTLDGIGGIIIGNLFTIPEEVLPEGYKFKNDGRSSLFQIVTGLGHKIQNNDWTTTIDAYNVILDSNTLNPNSTVTRPTDLDPNQSSPTGNRTAPDTTDDGLKYPFSGKFTLTSVLGDSRGTRTHEGVDLAIPAGTTIYAVEAGTIDVADSIATDDAGGIEIRMKHSAAGSKLDGKITQYSHLQELKVRQGQVVTKGQPIGISGNTGNSGTGQPYGPHLHFEVRSSNGAVENPATYFPLFG